MGSEIKLSGRVTLKANVPIKCNLRLIRHGVTVAEVQNSDHITHTVTQTGAYRIEAYISFRARQRGWIFSNPIYVRPD